MTTDGITAALRACAVEGAALQPDSLGRELEQLQSPEVLGDQLLAESTTRD